MSEGSRRLKYIGYFKKVREGSKRLVKKIKEVQKSSGSLEKVQKDSKRFKKVQEGSRRF